MFSNNFLIILQIYCYLLLNYVQNDLQRHNVLFVIFDDLRPALGGYGDPLAKTPNLDALISKSHYFTKAYAQQALCAPSRNSLLTSRRPDSLHLYDFFNYWRRTVGNFTTLPQYFKENGYFTYSVGKIFHPGQSSNNSDDYPLSWSTQTFHGSSEKYMKRKVCPGKDGKRYWNLFCPVKLTDQPLNTLPDIQSTQEAICFLRQYATNLYPDRTCNLYDNKCIITSQPYFLAVGYHKPHINFRFPRHNLKKFLLQNFYNYTEDKVKPADMPKVAWNPYNDIRKRDDFKNKSISFPYGPIKRKAAALIRQGYYASVNYVDDLFGQLMEYINLNNTVILVTSDHGWSLGEHAEWAKYSNFDVAVRVPLIIYSPEIPTFGGKGHRIDSLVELVDIFPSLVDLLHLPEIEYCKNSLQYNINVDQILCTEGKSFYQLLLPGPSPSVKSSCKWFAAYSQYPRPGTRPTVVPDSDKPRLNAITIMGYSIRTDYYRYTIWIQYYPQNFTKDWNKIYGEELYDHRFNDHEINNLIYDKNFNTIRYILQKLLKTFFQPEIIENVNI